VPWEKYIYYVQNIGSRYFAVAGLFFVLYYFLLYKKISHKKIQQRLPKRQDYIREVGYSLLTIFIFAFVPLFILHMPSLARYTTLYTRIEDYGWAYFFLAFPVLFLLHDTYFYWTHRAMHHKKLFRVDAPGASQIRQSLAVGGVCVSSAGSRCGSRHFRRVSFYPSRSSACTCCCSSFS
jgi:sterol desaturase/sphingolipid hydroxylase (fatty acid hydroxylase superfamily)